MVTREQLNSLLQENIITVEFVKKDNSVRVMRCTQRLDIIPETKHSRKLNENLIVVYDVDIKAWRSFDFTRVNKVS